MAKRTSLLGYGTFAALALAARLADAGAALTTEAVTTYSGVSPYTGWTPTCPTAGNLPNAVPDATGFRNQMTSTTAPFSNQGYYVLHQYIENGVWNTDFYDPQVSSQPTDNDLAEFDQGGTAISYLVSHGNEVYGDSIAPSNTCGGFGGSGGRCQPCTAASQCTSPLPGTRYPAICRRIPGDTTGSCSYSVDSRSAYISNCTNGVSRQGDIYYNSGAAKWGEDPSHSWAGAGTNGGTNVVQLHISHPHGTARGSEWFNAFAGIVMIASPLIHSGGDTALVSNRGFYWAAGRSNPNSSVAQSYLAGQASIGTGGQAPCCSSTGKGPNGATCTDWTHGNNNFGGGYGVNGCGGSVVGTLDSSYSYTQFNLALNWITVQNDANKAVGNSYYWEIWSCNYDCNAIPFTY